MNCDMYGLWSLYLWTNHLLYLNYWVSLGRFYLLDIHCDYCYISPLCGVAQTPDCGISFKALYVVSPRRPTVALLFSQFPLEESFRPSFGTSIIILAVSSRGFIQTLVWHQYYYSCSFLSRSHSDPRLAPSILLGFREDFRPISLLFPPCIIVPSSECTC